MRSNSILGFIILGLALSGCSSVLTQGNDLAKQGITTARSINDAKLSGSEAMYCDGQSTGAVAREYGDDRELWDKYWDLCNTIRGISGTTTIPPYPGVNNYEGEQ